MNCLGATTEAALFDDFLWFCCDSGRRVRKAVSRLRSKGQGVALIGFGRDSIFKVLELTLLDHVHRLDPGNQGARSEIS